MLPAPSEPCRTNMHSIGYAEQFYNAYKQRFGVAPPVDEWRFHDFGLFYSVGDVEGWWARVDKAAAWSVAHGANMVLGAWGFMGWSGPVVAYQEYMKQAMGRIMNDPRINAAAYWSNEPWVHSVYPLVDASGNLTPVGQTFVNPLTDVPTDVKIVGSAEGHAKLRWSNTTQAWPVEAEFWVQSGGSNNFVFHKTELVASAGENQSPLVVFKVGDIVRGRVRYYNRFGEASWSPFSDTVLLALTEPDADQRTGSGKRPLFCLFRLCQ